MSYLDLDLLRFVKEMKEEYVEPDPNADPDSVTDPNLVDRIFKRLNL